MAPAIVTVRHVVQARGVRFRGPHAHVMAEALTPVHSCGPGEQGAGFGSRSGIPEVWFASSETLVSVAAFPSRLRSLTLACGVVVGHVP